MAEYEGPGFVAHPELAEQYETEPVLKEDFQMYVILTNDRDVLAELRLSKRIIKDKAALEKIALALHEAVEPYLDKW